MTTRRTPRLDLRVKSVLCLSLGTSVVANILAAESSLIGRSVAAWFPLALLLVVEVLTRAPRSSGWLGWVVASATGLVALAAAVASFSHMREVALAAGESELVAVLFPLTVDGLAVVCSAALVELGRRENPAVEGAEVVSVESLDSADAVSSSPAPGSQQSLPDPDAAAGSSEGVPVPAVVPLPAPVPLVPLQV